MGESNGSERQSCTLSTIGLDSEPTASTQGVEIDAEQGAVRFLCNVVDKK